MPVISNEKKIKRSTKPLFTTNTDFLNASMKCRSLVKRKKRCLAQIFCCFSEIVLNIEIEMNFPHFNFGKTNYWPESVRL